MQNNYEDAISAYLYAVYNLAEEPVLYFYIAQCHLSQGRIAEADENLSRVIERAPNRDLLKRAKAMMSELSQRSTH